MTHERQAGSRGGRHPLRSALTFVTLAATLGAGCNSIFGIQEGKPRPICVDGTGLLIDDMEDGEGSICTLGGRQGHWYTAGDKTLGAILTPAGSLDPTAILGRRGDSHYAAHFSGSGFTKWGALMGLHLREEGLGTKPFDASNITGLRFWMKSNAPVQLSVRTAETILPENGGTCVDTATARDCNNDFAFQVTAPGSDWTPYDVPFAALRQQPGGSATWNPRFLDSIQFNVGPDVPFDVWVDDLRFYYCEAAACPPTCTDPAFPVACASDNRDPASCRPPGTDCAAVATWCADLPLIDDMEDGDSAICASDGRRGSWFVSDDQTSSTLTPPPNEAFVQTAIPGGRGTSRYAAHLAGAGFTAWGAGIAFDLNAAGSHLYDASPFAGIAFWMKNTSPVTVQLPVPETTPSDEVGGACVDGATDRNCLNHFGFDVPASRDWALYKVPFAALRQQVPFHGRGNLIPGTARWDPSRVIGVSFASGLSAFDFWVDDLRFYSSCETGGCVPTCAPNAPVACPASSARPAACWPAGTDCASPPERIDNRAVWGSGPADVWTFGFSADTLAGVLRRWNGAAWSPATLSATPAMFGGWGSGPDDVWALGDDGTILHWNGSAWLATPSATSSTFNGVWGSGPADVWAIESPGSLRHFGGSVWSPPSGTAGFLAGLWGSGPGDVWAVGGSDPLAAAGVILHWDGSVWSPVSGGTPPLFAVWGSGPTDVWAVGAAGAVVHWDGSAWVTIDGGTVLSLNGVSGSGPADVWAVGDNGTIVHWDGAAWTPFSSGSVQRLNGVWGSGPADVWAVGDDNTVIHWDGTRWSASPQ